MGEVRIKVAGRTALPKPSLEDMAKLCERHRARHLFLPWEATEAHLAARVCLKGMSGMHVSGIVYPQVNLAMAA